ncbi:MAG: Fic family protein [Chitinophagales bacterium]|jgi:Fic family protein|nr:Fic family protein [Chitinophagales bacterium]MBP9219834.1 Fic family protein [Chitinophagales bacterium]MBP9794412.1 Fic family protein [Chitinophagales bacterium]
MRIFTANSPKPMAKYIYEYKNWTDFTWEDTAINTIFGEVRLLQGKIIGQMNALGFYAKEETTLTALTTEIVKSSEIEGELLNYEQVRSSIARRLGINTGGLVPSSRHIEGVVEMILDATQHYELPLTVKRLFGWHAALFPTGYSGPYEIEAGQYRTGKMQVVSGAMGKEKVHYEAVKPEVIKKEMDKFLDWFNKENCIDQVLKVAIAHFWFIIIHPFDDGNGRIGRALSEMLLARSEGSGERFYSMSSQILLERKRYYEVLQKVQHSSGDITEWLNWFLHCLKNAMLSTENITKKILRKAEFWKLHEHTPINERQRLLINKLFDGFEGKLQTSKWAKIAKTSTDTALRDIKDLVEKNILQQTADGGRNANYVLVDFKTTP